ncbi:globin-coupled sensor protein [Sagittula marina]|uniref:globin-coupled sensor protein n=1 Tax=Sagittula marina TaxID=943940 RepID=UPI001608CBC7|nr:globin-coupled sensor protein [Sagittula marina]
MPHSFEEKLKHYHLDGENRERLKEVGEVLLPELDKVLENFYVRAKANPEAAAFFSDQEQMDTARSAQKKHWERILRADYSQEYFDSIERIGRVHAQIKLPIEVYMSAYTMATSDLITIFLTKSRQGFRRKKLSLIRDQICVLTRAFALDIERVVETTFRVQAEEQNIAFEHLSTVIDHMADGNLSEFVPDPHESDFPASYNPIRQKLNSAIDKLGQTLGTVSRTMDKLLMMIDGVGDSASDLSNRTASQAASLEETAAAIHELTENVRQSSDNTNKAKSVAGDAARKAEDGADSVSEASEAMGRIQTSSDRITQIIGMIDDIAFQTNLLALNAGVEAARAGTAGRGFAVVAEEVRVLAGNASDAAKQIKDLVTASSGEVASGVELIQKSAETLETIVKNFEQVTALSNEIASASAEQSTALSEVNSAISQMDIVTQQNAAMVDDTTSATKDMRIEAMQLRKILETLTIPAQNGNHSATPINVDDEDSQTVRVA